MNVSLDLYKVYYYVCIFKSVTKTANFLYVSQPAITKHIKNLENNLGKTLISLESKFKEKDNYDLIIKIVAGVSTIKKLLLPVLSDFNKRHPRIKFELSTYSYLEAIQKLREGRVDLIFLSLKEKEEDYNDLIFEKWLTVTDTFVVSKNIKNKFPDKINILDLNKYPIICKSGKSVTRENMNDIFNKNGLKFIPTYELSGNWLVEEYVNLDLGIGLLTKDFIEKDLEKGNLVEIKTDICIPKKEIGYAYRKNAGNVRIIKEIIHNLNENVKKMN